MKIDETIACGKAYADNNSTTAAPSLQSVYNPPRYRGEVGWICPICGRGNAPSTAYCNCNMTKPDIVYANGGLTIGDCTPIDCCDGITTRALSHDNIEYLKNQTYTTARNCN